MAILPLGSAKTGNFQIGNAELRFGAMSKAGQLTQAHSAGLTESTSVKFDQQKQELKAGLPKQLVDSVITETSINVTANAYEYTRSNIKVMLNEGIDSVEPTNFVAKGLGANGTTSLTVRLYATAAISASGVTPADTSSIGASAAVMKVDSLLGVFPTATGQAADFSVVKVSALSWIAAPSAIATPTQAQKDEAAAQGVPTAGSLYVTTVTVTLAAATPLLTSYSSSVGLTAYPINNVGIGNSAATQYVTVDVLGINHKSGLPQGFRFWKASISGGLDYAFSNDNFAVTPLSFTVLQPSAEDWAGPLAGTASAMAASAPLGFYWSGQAA